MQTQITTSKELKLRIAELESKKIQDWKVLQNEFSILYESVKPINFIKSTVKELTSQPDFKGDLIDATISLSAGYISKKLAVGDTHNSFKQLFGTLVQLGITNYVAKHSEVIKLTALDLIDKFVNKQNRFSHLKEHQSNGKEKSEVFR